MDSAVTQYRAVKLNTSQTDHATAATTLGESVLGVVQHTVAAADAGKQVANVRLFGITKIEAGAALAADVPVRTSATGTAVAIAGTATAREPIIGRTLTAASGAGEWIDVFLYGPGSTITNQ
jgi:hypothetical protein